MQPKIKTKRFYVLVFGSIFLLFVFLARLIWIQFSRSDFLTSLAVRQQTYYSEIEPERGLILDRNKKRLVLNVPSFSLYAVPPLVDNKSDVAGNVADVLGADRDFLRRRLNRKKKFVWLARKLDHEKMETVKALGLKGLYFIKEPRRSYPGSSMAAQVIGFAGLDNIGLEGLEKACEAYLKGVSGWTLVLKDAKKRDLVLSDAIQPPIDGYSVVLTIDEVVQYIVERELETVFRQYHAKGAMAIVMDVSTGQILAMANRPTFDLNRFSDADPDARRNRCVTDFFEPGSVFKIVTATAALDEGQLGLEDKFYCEKGRYKVGGRILHDAHSYGWLTFLEVFQYSSNIGATKIAYKIGAQAVYQYGRLFGFGQTTQSGIPGEVTGIFRPVSHWSKTSLLAIPMGQEVAVTALQLAAAVSTIANGGVYMKPYLVQTIVDKKGEVIKEFSPERLRRVMSEETARNLNRILTQVVKKGTGRRAGSKIFQFAGKTGTAQKVAANGTYSHRKFIASFAGFAPVSKPRIAIVVIVDEPRPYYYGGVVSAPVFRQIAEDVLKYYQVSSSRQ